MNFSAALLAGGTSRRMGQEKALLVVNSRGQTLLERQLALLGALNPREILLSCRYEQGLPVRDDVREVHDQGTAGPLGGVTAVLHAIYTPFVVILGVDMARMSLAVLRRLVLAARETSPAVGIVPRTSFGPQPTAAVLPRKLAPLARVRLRSRRDLSLQALVRDGVNAGLLQWLDMDAEDEPRFANWNRPSDVPPIPDAEEEEAGTLLPNENEQRSEQNEPPS